MSGRISQEDLRENTNEIVRALARGEDFTVTRDGAPVGELRPYRRHMVRRDVLVAAMKGAPGIDADRVRADLDNIAGQDIEPGT